MQDLDKPVDDPTFWRERLIEAIGQGVVRNAVYAAPEHMWHELNEHHKQIIGQIVKPQYSVLDAGCGFGRASEFIDCAHYTGVDMTPDFIRVAKELYPNRDFQVGDLTKLDFPDNSFDYSICISIMIMVIRNLGWMKWEAIQNELLRVSRRGILCLEYGVGDTNTTSDTYYLIKKHK